MSTEPTQPLRRRKKLNVTAIKTTIVFFVGMATALGSALTGLAPQAALAPSLRWMFGFAPEKAQGSALRFVCFAVFAALVGVSIGHGVNSAMLLGNGIAAFLGATVGALIVLPIAKTTALTASRRLFLTAAMGVTLWVVTDSARLNEYHVHTVAPVGLLAVAGIGLLVGALTQAGVLPGGLLMVAGLYYLGHFGAVPAIATSLLVIVLAALLPAWGYGKQGLVDTDYGGATITGGILGGIGGGIVLAYSAHNPRPVLMFFGVVAMFLCARELYRLTMSTPDEPPAPAPDI
jgi:uncharacterized membrane protein YfcA